MLGQQQPIKLAGINFGYYIVRDHKSLVNL